MDQLSESSLRRLATGHREFILSTIDSAPSQAPSDVGHWLLQIPRPTPIVSKLEDIGLCSSTSQQISDVYLKSTQSLWESCQSSIQKAYSKASAKGQVSDQEMQIMINAWKHSYTQQIRTWADAALSRARDAVARARTTAITTSVKEKKPIFNHEYTPLLEQYFQYNAYPPAPDRAVLARKSLMTPRQIEVWFQNHRNRAKKEGKVLPRLTQELLSSEFSLKYMEDKMPYFTIPINERRQVKEANSFDRSLTNDDISSLTPPASPPSSASFEIDPLNPPRSAHAFPVVYVPHNATPAEPRNFTFPPSIWYRKPATHLSSPRVVDMDELIMRFNQKLHLRAVEPRARGHTATRPWCADRYTFCCPAPHPALVRPTRIFPDSPGFSFRRPVVHTPSSCPDAFRSPSPSRPPVTLQSSQLPSSTPSRRKVAALPRRTPQHQSTSHRHPSPAMSESTGLSPISSSSSSRIPSGNSETFSRYPSSSSSNPSSTSPTTPELLSSPLPHDVHSSTISTSGVDFSVTNGAISPPSELRPSSAQSKQHFPFLGLPFMHLSPLIRLHD
ncbi:hypothetical protein H0H93_015467 [Arthromyces matolae]|nr:hypothetical protein H0H93_015467 [Arthromyces matolae]